MKIKTEFRRWFLPVAILVGLGLMSVIATPVAAQSYPGPFFSISLLAPNTSTARNQWATLMVEQLPKIGINVDIFDHTGWAQIGPRTWGHPGPYPIPTYAEGGYDILFVGNGWGLDFDPTGLFTSDGITPVGDNFYQYASEEMDWVVGNYTQSFVFAERMEYAKDIQAILYEDNPSLCIIYPTSLYPHDVNFEGWNGLLWASSYQPMENWSLGSGVEEFHYATNGDFVDFHPLLFEATYDAEWLHQIYNGLVERDPLMGNSYQPRILESLSTTDGVTYDCVLKDDLYWADGTPITTEDIEYNFLLAIDPNLGHSTLSFNEQYIDEDTVTIINAKEFTLTFLQPYVFQDSNLATYLIPKHIWSTIDPANHAAQAVTWATSEPEKLIGCGPYKMAEYDGTNSIIHLTKNEYFDDYWGSEPIIDDIYFEYYSNAEGAISALASGQIDLINAQFFIQPEQLIGVSGITYTLVDDPGNQEMCINMEHPYIGNGELLPIAGWESAKKIRKAISHIIPREIIVEEILGGLGFPGVTHWPKVSLGFDEDLPYYEYSIETALAYMEAAGYDTTVTTNESGIGLVVVMSILAFAGASQVFFLKRRK
ncbi:MAG TPA: ABC transporter substrate-binding protein [Candidatus Bathyarchaeia archaeon]|nr:ABC transporter substrate-binding protein [Candidatus Bathyarchaeia archaeon]